jgi:hypothetical protein
MRLPDFFIVGHSKSGTTALYEMLKQHPQIYLPPGKEPWFFAEELRERTPPRPEGIPGSLEEYAGWFTGARPEQRVGEASPQYLRSRSAARNIAQVAPDARIIAIFREPASFLQSLHLQFLQANIETESDFGRALALEPSRRDGHSVPRHTYWPQSLLYSEHTRYVEQLRRFHTEFPDSQVHVVIYEEFRDDNPGTVREILRFLEIDETVAVEPLEANPTVRARSQALNELVHAVGVGRGPVSRAVKGSIKFLTPATLRRNAFHAVQEHIVFGGAPAADATVIAGLRSQLKPEVVALSEYLHRDLVKLWGYDSVD